jgi:hypothetical protein
VGHQSRKFNTHDLDEERAKTVSRYSELVQATGESLKGQDRKRDLCLDFALRFTRGLREYMDVAPEHMLCFKPSEGGETAAARPAHGTVERHPDGFYVFGMAIQLQGREVYPYRPFFPIVVEMRPTEDSFELRINDTRTKPVPTETGEAEERARRETYRDLLATMRREVAESDDERRIGF